MILGSGPEQGAQYVGVLVYCDSPADASSCANVDGTSGSTKFQDVYWRCAITSLVSLRLHDDTVRLLVISNVDPRQRLVDQIRLGDLMDHYRIEWLDVELTYRRSWATERWGNVLFVFDVLEWAVDNLDAQDLLVLADADTLWTTSSEEVFSTVSASGLMAYGIDYLPDHVINGLTRRDCAKLAADLGGDVTDATPFYGGELYGFGMPEARLLVDEFRRIWRILVSDEPQVCCRIVTEEHMFSLLFWMLRMTPYDAANGVVRRIATFLRWRDVRSSDAFLTVWHLPAEKEYGFRRAWRRVRSAQRGRGVLTASNLEDCFDIRTRHSARILVDNAARLWKAGKRRLLRRRTATA